MDEKAIYTAAGKLICKEFDEKCFAQAASYYKDFVKKLQEKYGNNSGRS